MSRRRGRAFGWVAAMLFAVGLAACSVAPRKAVPEALVSEAAVPGYAKIRFWGDDAASIGKAAIEAEAVQSRARPGPPDWYFLSISGGGSNGAFGAGLITGWTANGTRPEFDIVTGVSTGSLTAPFAFLGPGYDAALTKAYTGVSRSDIYVSRGLLGALTNGAFADDGPLRNLVVTFVTDQMVADIAREHRRGRRLFIGTTNLDADRPVVWDIGAIAASDVSTRKELISDILIASASIPGLFPPVRTQVAADGVAYDEVHVDGGTANQAFLFPSNFSSRDLDRWTDHARNRAVYIIRNGKVTPEYSVVNTGLPAVAGKSINSLIRTQGIGDLYRIYEVAKRDALDFNAIWIPASFTLVEPQPFDPDYMRAVCQLGRDTAVGGIPWSNQPPG